MPLIFHGLVVRIRACHVQVARGPGSIPGGREFFFGLENGDLEECYRWKKIDESRAGDSRAVHSLGRILFRPTCRQWKQQS